MRTKRILFLVCIIVFIFLPVFISYTNYQESRITNDYLEEFTNNLNEVIQEENTFLMTDVAKFEWDRMFMFQAYTPRDVMEQTIGTEWSLSHSYLGYLIDESSLGDYPLSDDSLHKLVFVKGDKVVLDITLDRLLADFTSGKGMIERNESLYVIEKSEDKYVFDKQIEEKYVIIRNSTGE